MSWEQLATIPETYFTAYGSLFNSLQPEPEDVLFVRGGTSSVGLASIQLGKSIGSKILASTRKEEKRLLLIDAGADYVLIEDGIPGSQLKAIFPQGVTKILELIGAATLIESMNLLNKHGIVCVTRIPGKKATLGNFYPIKDIPTGVYLTGFVSNFSNQELIDQSFYLIKQHKIKPTIAKHFLKTN